MPVVDQSSPVADVQQAVPVAQEAWIKPYCEWMQEVEPIVGNLCSPETGFSAGWRAALASLPCKSGEGAGEREAIARIIDPNAWSYRDYSLGRAHHWDTGPELAGSVSLAETARQDADKVVRDSLTKADAILDATQTREAEGQAIAAYLTACAIEADRQAVLFADQDRSICDNCRQEAKSYRNAARMILEGAHVSHRAALNARGGA